MKKLSSRFWKLIAKMSIEDKRRLRLIALRLAKTLGRGETADDLIHDAYVAIASGCRRVPPGVPLIAGLIMTIYGLTWNLHKKRWRDVDPIEDLDFVSAERTPEEFASASEEVERILSESFSDEEIAAMVLQHVAGMEGKEIQKALNLSNQKWQAQRRRVTRKIKTLRNRLTKGHKKDDKQQEAAA
jgi:DNA-directed RNA polymerase specialized sigma24 family protein